MTSRFRPLVLLVIVAVVGLGAVVVAGRSWFEEAVPAPRSPNLPDLVSLPLADFLVGTDEEGNEALRFSSTIANAGDGPLMIRAGRAFGWSERWRVVQWFDEPDGEPSGTVTGANLVLGGHGHEHWHLKFGVSYRLFSEDGRELASQTKAGFCFFDQVASHPELAGAPAEGVFKVSGCGRDGDTSVEMGMSVGWSDPYFWQLEDQSVTITGLADGRYRLTADADPDNWLTETNEANNETWVVIALGTLPDGLRSVEIVESAPEP